MPVASGEAAGLKAVGVVATSSEPAELVAFVSPQLDVVVVVVVAVAISVAIAVAIAIAIDIAIAITVTHYYYF